MVPVAPGQPFLAMAPMPPAMAPIAPAMAPVGPMVPPMVSPIGQMGPVPMTAVSFSDMPMTAEVVDMAPSQPFCASQNFSPAPEMQSYENSSLVEGEQSTGLKLVEEKDCRQDPQESQKSQESTGESEQKKEEVQETVTLKVRKKPTRRGGKRARHRPCHAAAAAMEWASSVGSAETPSFGEPGSGEEAEGEEGDDEEKEEKEDADLKLFQDSGRKDSKDSKNQLSSKPRSFYPLAARLRVASAGLKPSAKSKDESRATSSFIKTSKKIGEADEVELATTKEDWMTEYPMRPSQIEVIEEVEPEPASASDVSDLKQEPTEVPAGATLSVWDCCP